MRIFPVGAHALLIELDGVDEARAAYRRITDAVAGGDAPAPADVVPAARTVLLEGVDPAQWTPVLESLDLLRPAPLGGGGEREVVVPMRYDGADLADVAEAWGCDLAGVLDRHQETVFTVAFCGFAPGFAYCTTEGALPPVGRRERPRTRVPAGAVGLAGEYCGVYPRAMPGGWQLLGTTELVLFDPTREHPALLRPGDRVRFEAVR